jgi:transcription elongation GreA/GreB family factor
MSRAFVKDQDTNGITDLPDRPISEYPNDVTAEGLAQIEAALAAAHQEHEQAQAADDRDSIMRAARDLRYWEARRATAHVVPNTADITYVRFGHTVTLQRDDGLKQTFRIVGEDEADPAKGTISHAAPLARALFGKSIGETARVGTHELEILKIE